MTTKLSIRQISVLTALDRDTVTRRLLRLAQWARSKRTPGSYGAPAALRAVLAPALAPEGTLEQSSVLNRYLDFEITLPP